VLSKKLSTIRNMANTAGTVGLFPLTRRTLHPNPRRSAGLGCYDPFASVPMLWNPVIGQLYSVGEDGKDDGEGTTLDIAVQIITIISLPQRFYM
jgi:hypothetical protein